MRVRLFALAVGLVLLGSAAGAAAERIDRVLAVVGGRVITESDVRAALTFGLVNRARDGADPIRTTLDQMIRQQLILSEVTRAAGAEADGAAVDRRVEAIRAGFASPAEFKAKLDATAMNDTRLRDAVEANLRIDAYMQQRFGAVAEPGNEEVEAYYNAHRAEFTAGGAQLTFEQAKAAVRERLIEERRNQAIEEWIARLRRRTEVTDLYFADSK